MMNHILRFFFFKDLKKLCVFLWTDTTKYIKLKIFETQFSLINKEENEIITLKHDQLL